MPFLSQGLLNDPPVHKSKILDILWDLIILAKSCRDASAGNRTRGLRMASGDFTTKPLMLLDERE
jgi:hypothetical protein